MIFSLYTNLDEKSNVWRVSFEILCFFSKAGNAQRITACLGSCVLAYLCFSYIKGTSKNSAHRETAESFP